MDPIISPELRILMDMIKGVQKDSNSMTMKLTDTLIAFAMQTVDVLETVNAAIKTIDERTLQLDERMRKLEK